MFKIATHPIMAGSILCALQTATGPPAAALDQWVKLINNTRVTIVKLTSLTSVPSFGTIDLLGADLLSLDISVLTSIDGVVVCRFYLKIVFDDGTTQIRRNVNVC